MRDATVAMGLLAGLIRFSAKLGAEVDELCRAADVDPRDLDDPDLRVPIERFGDVFRLAQKITERPALALHFGEAIGMSQLSIVGLLMEASETIGHAYQQLQRYGRLAVAIDAANDSPRFALERHDEALFLTDRQPWSEAFPELTESGFAWLACGPRRYMERSPVLSAQVTWSKPPHWKEYERVLRCPVRFEADRNALELHPDAMDWPVRQNPRYVFGILAERADELLEGLRQSVSVAARLSAMLAADLHEGNTTVQKAASRMGVSRQTLFRRLREEGTSFSSVLAGLRCDLAQEYLNGSKASLDEVAYLVGYSDSAAFSRAFKRWTGTTPGQFRQNACSATRYMRRAG